VRVLGDHALDGALDGGTVNVAVLVEQSATLTASSRQTSRGSARRAAASRSTSARSRCSICGASRSRSRPASRNLRL
jgi:hypothetical protein